jgi:hypothetical protein
LYLPPASPKQRQLASETVSDIFPVHCIDRTLTLQYPVVKRGDGSTATILGTAGDFGLTRYFVAFTGPLAQATDCGSNFLAALRGAGGITHNWYESRMKYWSGLTS